MILAKRIFMTNAIVLKHNRKFLDFQISGVFCCLLYVKAMYGKFTKEEFDNGEKRDCCKKM